MRNLICAVLAATPAFADDPRPPVRFERVVIDADFPGGYQVEVADVNGDKKPDVVALGGSTLAWYENPSWKKRVVSTAKQAPDIISGATADLDGDGKAEIAIAYDFSMNEPRRGKLLLAIQGAGLDDPWTFRTVYDANSRRVEGGGMTRVVTGGGFAGGGSGNFNFGYAGAFPDSAGKVPSIHRLRWGTHPRPGGPAIEKKVGLFVAPLFGPAAGPPGFNQEPAHFIFFDLGVDPLQGRWKSYDVGDAPVMHAIEVVDLGDDGYSAVLAASNRGVTAFRIGDPPGLLSYRSADLVAGFTGEAPKRGTSEVHLGKFKDGRKFLATVEPWHGTDVAIYPAEAPVSFKFGHRIMIDSTLKEGHALWVADVDGDGDDEVFAGYRGGTGGVLMYDFDGQAWNRSVLDPTVTAQDLRGGDIDGDGTPDVVAIGGKSHNVVWYRPIRPSR